MEVHLTLIPFNLNLFKVSQNEKITYDMSLIQSKNLPFIWLIGQQNTGKKTHGELLKENFGFEHISVTELLRSETGKDTTRGTIVKECLDSHKKISDVFHDILIIFLCYNFYFQFLIIELIKEALLNSNASVSGYVISNFPKNSKQADLFMKEIGNVNFIFYLYCDTISLLSRAQERNEGELNETVLKRNFAYATRDIKLSLGKFLSKVENVSTREF